MAGLFSKKSKKDKEEKKNAAAAQVNNSAPVGHQKSGSLNGPIRDNSSTNNSVTNSNHLSSTTPTVAASQDGGNPEKSGQRMYHLQQQQQHSPQLQQQQLNPHHVHSINGNGSGNGNNSQLVSASSISTHNSITNLSSTSNSGPWISSHVLSTNPFPRFSHTASYVHTGSDIYVFGGNVKGSAQKDMHVIDSRKLGAVERMYYMQQSRLFVFVSLGLFCLYCLFVFRIILYDRNGVFLFLISCAPFCLCLHGVGKSCKSTRDGHG